MTPKKNPMHAVAMLIAATTMLATAPAALAAATCEDVYHATESQTMAVIKNSSLNADKKREALGDVFDKTVDSKWIGRFVLGRFWKEATPEQQKEYLSLYAKYLRKIYISKFDSDDLADFTVTLASFTPLRSGDYDARTLINRPNDAVVHVNYLLTESGGTCRVHDITVENISLLTSQRSEFQTLAGRSGIAGVLEALKAKTQK